MKIVYVLQHVHEFEGGVEDVKFIGVYSSRDKAENAISRLSEEPGFKETKEGFCIDKYEIDIDHWTEGFATILPKE